MNSLYENDFQQWIEKQKEFLQSKDFNNLDIENLIEELDEMANSDFRALISFLSNVLLHLLKYNYQINVLKDPWTQVHVIYFWKTSATNARNETLEKLDEHPALNSKLEEALNVAYKKAKNKAISEMNIHINDTSKKLNKQSFPEKCPWEFEQIMKEDFFPEEPI